MVVLQLDITFLTMYNITTIVGNTYYPFFNSYLGILYPQDAPFFYMEFIQEGYIISKHMF